MKASLLSAILTAILAVSITTISRAEGVVVQWEKIYNGPGNGPDWPSDVTVDRAGNVILIGNSYVGSNNADFYIAKYAARDGTLLWDRQYDSPGSRNDSAAAVVLDSAGNVIVTGSSGATTATRDFYTAKYAAGDGTLLWDRGYNGPGNGRDQPSVVAIDSEDNVIVSGYASTYKVGSSSYSDFYTAKYAAVNGALLWEKFFSVTEVATVQDSAYIVAIDRSNNVIVAGRSYRVNNGESVELGVSILKYAASNGALLWSVRQDDGISSLTVDDTGNVFVTGANFDGTGVYYGRTAKYAAANGALLWDTGVIGNGDAGDFPFGGPRPAIKLDEEGNVMVARVTRNGYVGSIGDTANWIHGVKYAAADGAVIGEWRSNLSFTASPGSNVQVDGAGNVFVTGYSYSGGNSDICTAKYAMEGGALLWEIRYNGTINRHDFGLALTVDDEGNVIVAGRINYYNDPVLGAGIEQDMYTVKYAPVDLDRDNDGLPDLWEIEHFGSTEGQSALDDTDGDGAVELLEYAFGTDPRAPHSVPTPTVIIEGGYLTTTITKKPGVRYAVETGATLDGDFSATSTTVLAGDATTLKVRDNVPVGTQSARFLRVHVTAAP